ncbi:MAG TPA: cytochrome b/b6 domain-containing protein [Acetobacteraceae bacterium]|nr:cytochrome b/b6 domain-containing protein [Acetobacteraceae bacterium]
MAGEPAATQGLRHAPATIVLHWLSAVLVASLWTIGKTIDFAPNGPLRIDYRSLHMLLGVTLGIVLVIRLAWRTIRGGMLPALDHGLLLFIARATHWLLYALMLVTVGLGVLNVWVRGDWIFNLVHVAQLVPGDRAFVRQIGDWHALVADAVLVVAGLHSAAALFHHFVLHDLTLRRMLPWSSR